MILAPNNKKRMLYFGNQPELKIDVDKHIIILGRGHSGTRAIAEIISTSGAFLGTTNGPYFDHTPPQSMYNAAQLYGYFVDELGGRNWDFSYANKMLPPRAYVQLVRDYLSEFIDCGYRVICWKLPEAILAAPWLAQLFPDAYFIYWIRDGRDNILKWHQTDELDIFNIPYPMHDDRLHNAAVSWVYQCSLIEAMPKPERWLSLRFEDFVNNQQGTLDILSNFLELELQSIPIKSDVIGRWDNHELDHIMPIMQHKLIEYGYVS